jgi:hypothetical protein
MVAALAAGNVVANDIYVSPDGNDSNSGTRDKPLQTIAVAKKRLAEKRSEVGGQRAEESTVWLRGGIYYIPETIVFTAEDSGTSNAPVVYAAAAGERVVISAGRKLDLKWEPAGKLNGCDGVLKAKVPAGFKTDQLFVDGKRQHMARYPNYDPKIHPYHGYNPDCISPERVRRWANPVGGFVHGLQKARWGGYSYVITGVNSNGEVQLRGGYQDNRCPIHKYGYFCKCMLEMKDGEWKSEYLIAMHKDYRFVENILEELDAPGEWFLDQAAGVLYFRPAEGLDMSKAVVEVAGIDQAFELRGSQEKPVRFLRFRNLEFRHTARTFMNTRESLMRSDWRISRQAALFMEGAEDVVLDGCVFSQMGGNAVFVSGYARRIHITGCLFEDIGAGCVNFVGRQDAVRHNYETSKFHAKNIDKTPGPKTDNYPANCLVDECLMHDFGLFEKQVAGVQICMAFRITARHCSIYDCPRAGINVGDGCWGGHVIEWCDVFDTVLETNDHGAFNCWGRDRFWKLKDATDQQKLEWSRLDVIEPIVLRNSRWRCDSGWDIDLDDAATHYEVYNNVMLAGGLKLGILGYYRQSWNNILINDMLHAHVWPVNSYSTFSNNIVTGGAIAEARIPDWGDGVDYNLLSSEAALKASHALGVDLHSIVGDPKFLDPAKGDYRVAEDSPAFKIGFTNFPMDRFGVTLPRLRALAATPNFPEITGGEVVKKSKPTKDWRGAKIKTISGMDEQSLTGMDEQRGAFFVEVPKGCAAEKAKLKTHDVVTAVDGKFVRKAEDFVKFVAESSAGRCKLTVWRDQKEVIVDLVP